MPAVLPDSAFRLTRSSMAAQGLWTSKALGSPDPTCASPSTPLTCLPRLCPV